MKSRVPQESRVGQLRRGGRPFAVALIAAVAILLVPVDASAVMPVLEFVVPGHSMPVSFTTESEAVNAEMAGFESLVHCAASHGEGEITGPRSTVSQYRFTGCTTERGSHENCQSKGAKKAEIKTEQIEADLVYIDEAKHEVGMLLNPGDGTYIHFECGGETAEGKGPFLAPVTPINQEATSFTATLNQLDSVQAPDEYEGEPGERLEAIPTGIRGSHQFVPTGVEAAFTVHPSVPVELKAITAQELESKQHGEEAGKQEEIVKHDEEALKKAEEHAKQVEEEASVQAAAAKKKLEEAEKAESQSRKAKSQPLTRAQLLTRALRKCERQPKKQRARCVASARNKYGPRAKKRGRGDK